MKQRRFLTIVIVAALMLSCNKEDKQATGAGDVILISKVEDGQTIYGISIYARTYSSFQSVKAVSNLDSEKTYNLKSDNGSKENFYYEMPDNEFTVAQPKAALYNFSAVFENGITQTFQNELFDKVLPIPVFVQCEYVAEPIHLLKLKWILNKDAAGYSVKIKDGSTLVFILPGLKSTDNSADVSGQGIGWATNFKPVSGKSYNVQLLAYMNEPNTSNALNIQAVSIADTTIVWGN